MKDGVNFLREYDFNFKRFGTPRTNVFLIFPPIYCQLTAAGTGGRGGADGKSWEVEEHRCFCRLLAVQRVEMRPREDPRGDR